MPAPTSLPTPVVVGGTGHISHTSTVHGVINAITTVPSSTKTANYTLALSDSGEVVEMNLGTALTLTVPPNSSVAFPAGTVVEVYRMGAGTVTLVAGSGVTLTTPAGSPLTLRVQGSTVSLRKRATDEWVISGDLG